MSFDTVVALRLAVGELIDAALQREFEAADAQRRAAEGRPQAAVQEGVLDDFDGLDGDSTWPEAANSEDDSEDNNDNDNDEPEQALRNGCRVPNAAVHEEPDPEAPAVPHSSFKQSDCPPARRSFNAAIHEEVDVDAPKAPPRATPTPPGTAGSRRSKARRPFNATVHEEEDVDAPKLPPHANPPSSNAATDDNPRPRKKPKLRPSRKERRLTERPPPNPAGNIAQRKKQKHQDELRESRKRAREEEHALEDETLVQNYHPPEKSAKNLSNPIRINTSANARDFPAAQGAYVGNGKVDVPEGMKDQKLESFKDLLVVHWDGK